MSEETVKYELIIREFEAVAGTTKQLPRKGKRLEIKIPSGVNNGTKVVLPNALKITDGKSGDILILIKVSPVETINAQFGTTIDLIFQICLHEIGGAENSDIRRYIEKASLVISRDEFFQAVIWAVWVSGMSRKAAAGFRRNNEEKFRGIDFINFAALDNFQLEAFIESLHSKPGKPVGKRAIKKWQAIHYVAKWLIIFSSDESFRHEAFQGKYMGSELDEADALRLKELKFPFIRATNASYLVKTLGGEAVKDDRWVKELLTWVNLRLDELEAKLQSINIPLGFFDTVFWCYCELFIHKTDLFKDHFDEKFGFLKN